MGLWGAAQAIAAGFGGLLGAGLSDARLILPDAPAFGAVFLIEGGLFLVSAVRADGSPDDQPRGTEPALVPGE